MDTVMGRRVEHGLDRAGKAVDALGVDPVLEQEARGVGQEDHPRRETHQRHPQAERSVGIGTQGRRSAVDRL